MYSQYDAGLFQPERAAYTTQLNPRVGQPFTAERAPVPAQTVAQAQAPSSAPPGEQLYHQPRHGAAPLNARAQRPQWAPEFEAPFARSGAEWQQIQREQAALALPSDWIRQNDGSYYNLKTRARFVA